MFNLDTNMASVNAVMTAPSTTTPNARLATLSTLPHNVVITAAVLTDETASKTGSFTALLTTTMDAVTTTAGAAANDTNDVMHVDTTTATLPANNETLQPLLFTYSHEEVQLLLEDAKLDGYQEGFEEGHRIGRKTEHEEGKEEGHSEEHTEGYEYGYNVCWWIDEKRQEEVHKKGLLDHRRTWHRALPINGGPHAYTLSWCGSPGGG